MSDMLDQMRARGENAVMNNLKRVDAMAQMALRGSTGQGDLGVAPPRLYFDGYLTAALKVVTIVPRESGSVFLCDKAGPDATDDFKQYILPPATDPLTLAPVAVLKIVAGSSASAFTFGTSNFNATGITPTQVDTPTLPEAGTLPL